MAGAGRPRRAGSGSTSTRHVTAGAVLAEIAERCRSTAASRWTRSAAEGVRWPERARSRSAAAQALGDLALRPRRRAARAARSRATAAAARDRARAVGLVGDGAFALAAFPGRRPGARAEPARRRAPRPWRRRPSQVRSERPRGRRATVRIRARRQSAAPRPDRGNGGGQRERARRRPPSAGRGRRPRPTGDCAVTLPLADTTLRRVDRRLDHQVGRDLRVRARRSCR